jgi:hypothetical protein
VDEPQGRRDGAAGGTALSVVEVHCVRRLAAAGGAAIFPEASIWQRYSTRSAPPFLAAELCLNQEVGIAHGTS